MGKLEINKVGKVIVSTAGRAGLKLKKYSPELLIFGGVVGIVASTVLACKATLKIEELIDESQEKIGEVIEAHEKFPQKVYSEKDYKRDLTIVYVKRVVGLTKIYLPAATLGILSIGAILGGYNIMRKRNVALLATYKGLEEAFRKYRKRVVEDVGEEKDKQYLYGVRKEMITVTETGEDGKEKKVKKTIDVIDKNGPSQYARFFDESCTEWNPSSEYNLTFLKCQQNYANDLLQTRGHIFLNEVYDMLGIPRSQAGSICGWVKGAGDDSVDFGIYDVNTQTYQDDYANDTIEEKRRAFVNGYRSSILLDFNVDGVIYDKI